MFQKETRPQPLPPYSLITFPMARELVSVSRCALWQCNRKITPYLNRGLRVAHLVFFLKVLLLVVCPFICHLSGLE